MELNSITFNDPKFPPNQSPYNQKMNQTLNHPMDAGKILTKSFDIYFKNFIALFIPFLLISIILYGIVLLLGMYFPEIFIDPESSIDSLLSGFEETQITEITNLYIGLIVLALFDGALLSISMVFAILITKNFIENEGKSFGEIFAKVSQNLIPIIFVGALASLLNTVGNLLLIIPGIIFSVWFSLTLVVLIEENLSPLSAMGRSKSLVSGFGFKIFGVLLLIGAVQFIIQIIPFFLIPANLFNPIIDGLLLTSLESVALPISGISVYILYKDQLFRQAYRYQSIQQQQQSRYGQRPGYPPQQQQQSPYGQSPGYPPQQQQQQQQQSPHGQSPGYPPQQQQQSPYGQSPGYPPQQQQQQQQQSPHGQSEINITDKKYCKNCGTLALKMTDKFCGNCGATFD